MFDSIVSHVDKCAGGIAQTEFFYAGEKLHKLREPVLAKKVV